MLNVQNITYTYDIDFKLENITFDLQKGETMAIVGPSGSGKTTLLKLLLGSIKPDNGKITLDEMNVTTLDIDKRNIGYCPQDQLLFPHLNVFDNIAMGLKAKKLPKDVIKEQVESLAKISDIYPLLKRKTNQISGGQKQRVSILRAIANSPKLLLLDEPFHNLDAQIKDQIVAYIKKVQSLMNVAIIFVTHDITEAKLLADKLLILINGSMKQVGTAKELSYYPNSLEVANAMGLPNAYPIKHFNNEGNSIELSIGTLTISSLTYQQQKNVLINPTGIAIIQDSSNKDNSFNGIIKGIVIDVLTQKQVLNVQVLDKKGLSDPKHLGLIQITIDMSTDSFEKNQLISFAISEESLKLF